MGDERRHIYLFDDYTVSIYLDLCTCLGTQASFVDYRFSSPSAQASLTGFITYPKGGYDWL